MSNGIGKTGMYQWRDSVSLWNIYLPVDIDRDKYIRDCYLSGTVTLINVEGEIVNKVKVGRLTIQCIDFPDNTDSLGSEVICLTAPYSGQLYVSDVFGTSKQYDYQSENQYRFYKKEGRGVAGLVIDGKGNVLLSVDGDGEDGVLTINVTNQERTGKLNINVNGDVSIINDGNTLVKSSTQVLIDSPKILLNESEEPVLLGQKVVDFLSEWLDILGTDSAGPYPLLNASKYIQFKNKLDELKSELTFVK